MPAVSGAEGARQRDRDVQQPIQRHAVSWDHITQRPALDQLHRQELDTIHLLDGVDRDDVRMIERGGGAGLLLESSQAIGISAERNGQHLDGDITTSFMLARDRLAHPSRGQMRGFRTARHESQP
jgi:hypothetical protein